MAVETVTVRLDETWKTISADNAAAMKWEVVGFRDAIFAIGDTAPAAGTSEGMRDRSIPPTVWGTAKVFARAVRDTAAVSVTRTVNGGNATTPILQKLALSAATFASNAASGSAIGVIQNKTAGSTLRVLSRGKRVAVNSDGSSAVVGLEPGEPGKFSATIRESHPDAGDFDTTFDFTVTAPPLTISGSAAGASEGQDYAWRPTVAGGYGERSYQLSGSLPTGWSMSSKTGAIYAPAGFVRAALGTISGLSITVADEAGQSATLSNLSISVTDGTFAALALNDTIGFWGCSLEEGRNWNWYTTSVMQRIGYVLQQWPFGNFAWPGARPDQYPVYLPGLLAAKLNVMWVGDWVNASIPGTRPAFETERDAILSGMTQFGAQPQAKLIILSTTRLTEAAKTATGGVAYVDQINAWCRAQHNTKIGNARVVFLDCPYDVSNAALGPTDLSDTVHDNTRGAIFNRGKQYADALKALNILPTGRALPTPGVPLAGNKTTNPNFTGTTGTSSGAGASSVTGTIATGYNVFSGSTGIVVAAEAANGRQRLTITGTQSATPSALRLDVTVSGLQRGKKYLAYCRAQISATDGVGAGSGLYNLALSAGIPNNTGSDGKGPMLSNYGDIPSPQRDGVQPVNPETGAVDNLGELWLISQPITCPGNGTTAFRIDCTPKPGTLNMMVDFSDFNFVEIHEVKGLPYYQGKRYDRGDSTYRRPFAGLIGPYVCGGFYPTKTNEFHRLPAANAANTWSFTPGDWSGDPDSYEGKVELSTDSGATWTTVVASLVAANWSWNASAAGLAAGHQVKTTVTATTTGFGATTEADVITLT